MTTPPREYLACDDDRPYRVQRESHLPRDYFNQRGPRALYLAGAALCFIVVAAIVVVALLFPR